MGVEVGGGGEEDVQGGGFGELAEVGVVCPEEFDRLYLAAEAQTAAVGLQALFDMREDFDTYATVFELDAGDDAPDGFAVFRHLFTLLLRKTVGNRDVAAVAFVDLFHPAAEKPAVG